MEQIYDSNPDNLFVDGPGLIGLTSDDVLEIRVEGTDFSSIKAVQDGRVYDTTLGMWNWFTPNPDAPLVFAWLACNTYPEGFADYPLEDTIREYYHDWYGYDVTDELFGITIARPGYLNPFYTYGAIALAAPAWAMGTALGIVAGNLLPLRAVSALSVALYGMFLAIIIPPARKNRVVAVLVALSFALSFVCNYLPGIASLSDGTRTILLTVLISCGAAVLFPVPTQAEEAEQ